MNTLIKDHIFDPTGTATNRPSSTDGVRPSHTCIEPNRSAAPHDLDYHTVWRNYHECVDRGPSLWISFSLYLAGLVAVWTSFCRQWARHHGRLPPTDVPSELRLPELGESCTLNSRRMGASEFSHQMGVRSSAPLCAL